MKLGIVSDTHDNTAVVEAAVERFDAEDVDAVIHCGDFVAPLSATPFDADFEFYAVRGNNDGEWGLQAGIEEFGTYLGEMGEVALDGVTVAAYHGTSQPIVDALTACGSYDYVVHGHTHQRVHEEVDGTVSINPGGVSVGALSADPAAVVVDLDAGDVTFHDLD